MCIAHVAHLRNVCSFNCSVMVAILILSEYTQRTPLMQRVPIASHVGVMRPLCKLDNSGWSIVCKVLWIKVWKLRLPDLVYLLQSMENLKSFSKGKEIMFQLNNLLQRKTILDEFSEELTGWLSVKILWNRKSWISIMRLWLYDFFSLLLSNTPRSKCMHFALPRLRI